MRVSACILQTCLLRLQGRVREADRGAEREQKDAASEYESPNPLPLRECCGTVFQH